MSSSQRALNAARDKISNFPKALSACAAEAAAYASCITVKDGLKKGQCEAEFQAFRGCYKKAIGKLCGK